MIHAAELFILQFDFRVLRSAVEVSVRTFLLKISIDYIGT
jgi:hypothetical protein